jgi:hypothetical protein
MTCTTVLLYYYGIAIVTQNNETPKSNSDAFNEKQDAGRKINFIVLVQVQVVRWISHSIK